MFFLSSHLTVNCVCVFFPSDVCVLKLQVNMCKTTGSVTFSFHSHYVWSVEEFSQSFMRVNVLHERGGAARCVKCESCLSISHTFILHWLVLSYPTAAGVER